MKIGRLKIFFIVFTTAVISNSLAYATPGQPETFKGSCTTYRVTVKKVEISTDKQNWVVLGEGEQEFDIASAGVGEQVGSYVSATSIPAGTYRYVRVTLSRDMYVEGSATSSGTTYYTTATTMDIAGGQLGIATTDSNQQALCHIVIPSGSGETYSPDPNEDLEVSGDDFIVTSTLSDPVTISESSGVLEIEFPTQNTLDFDPDDVPGKVVFWPIPPDISIDFLNE
ncbi:MAG: DUF4382 domain-containing protein [Candidatus Omnitrophica bacterium]|nr:DUF4382 domain-containing protein [Candidatus Omnitrophota bacterium]